ncbi:MAG: PQQ-dependent sugar dehydrogenase [Agriterribacter sp.]
MPFNVKLYYTNAVLCIIIFLTQSCAKNENNGSNNNDTTQVGTLPPVETNSPNTNYSAAFSGQTRIAGIKTGAAYKVENIQRNLNSPWAIVPLPDGRLLITEKAGTMKIFSASGQLEKTVTGLPVVDAGGQGGLLDAAPDPDFSNNRVLYWSFSETQAGGGNLMALAKGILSANETTIENASVIFRATPKLTNSNLHYGSRIAFSIDGNLFVSTGERSVMEGRVQAQRLNSNLGKIFRLTKDGEPAAGNPFAEDDNANPEIYAYGIRNPQGLAIHPVTGDLWEAEFGPRGGDEVNIIKAGKNYGWPTITYGIEYSGATIGQGITQKDGMEQPVYYWDPVVSPSGITFYTGDAIPEWKNNLFLGALSGKHIVRLVIDANNKVVAEERLMADKNERVRDIANHPNGSLYAVTDEGNLYRIGM